MYAYISSSSKLFLQSSHSCLYPTKISSFSSPEDKPSCWSKVLQTVLCKHWILMLALLFNGTHLLLWLWIISFPICFQMYHFQRGYLCWSIKASELLLDLLLVLCSTSIGSQKCLRFLQPGTEAHGCGLSWSAGQKNTWSPGVQFWTTYQDPVSK